jgi:1-aminocyclopropane-1-carboxylate deaminase/D-cysteine desulfhydrase-like pyridoxal-dependent ACC family enzyme
MCEMGCPKYTLALAVATGSTFAGLWCGIQRSRAPVSLRGFSIARPNPRCKDETIRAAERVCGHLDIPVPTPDDLDITDQYIGDGYACPTAWSEEGVSHALRTEGLLLDHTYSGKAFGALRRELKSKGRPAEPIVFWHTGGVAGAIDSILAGPD